ncbi:hypothetical protein [Paraburkholderia terricola]|uniref:hypothetical protein n=1 Tax=Paraburkholderia terricola TaxID=169427 RepID=UPI003ECCB78C
MSPRFGETLKDMTTARILHRRRSCPALDRSFGGEQNEWCFAGEKSPMLPEFSSWPDSRASRDINNFLDATVPRPHMRPVSKRARKEREHRTIAHFIEMLVRGQCGEHGNTISPKQPKSG